MNAEPKSRVIKKIQMKRDKVAQILCTTFSEDFFIIIFGFTFTCTKYSKTNIQNTIFFLRKGICLAFVSISSEIPEYLG